MLKNQQKVGETGRFERFTLLMTHLARSVKRIKPEKMAGFRLKGPHVSSLPDGMTASALRERCDEDKAAILRPVEKSDFVATGSAQRRYRRTDHS